MVGYPTLTQLTPNLFVSPYGATSLREYFANCFEEYFARRQYNHVKKISPAVYEKIELLLGITQECCLLETETKKPDYVSYSSIKDWKFCPHYYKITRIDKVAAGRESIHTAFGKALHSTSERIFKQEKEGSFDYPKDFSANFSKEISSLPKEIRETISEKDITDFEQQGRELAELIHPAANQYFGEFECFSAEEDLLEEIEEYKIDDYKYKGYIDLVLKTKDGKYHIIDQIGRAHV